MASSMSVKPIWTSFLKVYRLHRTKVEAGSWRTFLAPLLTQPLDERFAKIGTYEVYQMKLSLVNGLPPRYRGESEQKR